jgi:2-keto-4-pentenoate hydratase/2-oxohepta-3-ene-1,7-dioic acid hydratase in catechol pathway
MKLIRFGKPGKEKPGLFINDDKYIDVSEFCADFNEEFFASDGLNRLQAWFDANKNSLSFISQPARLGAPLCRPSKIVCIGLNFGKHAKETGMERPTEPVIFFKATSALCGPNDNLIIPRDSTKTDWEVELALVISKKTKYVSEEEAMNYVGGYLLHNDYSDREFQLERGGQWVKGKSADTFAPLGPYLVTPDERLKMLII